MANSVDISFIIAATVSMILRQLSLPLIPLVVYTDSLLLYDYIIKLGIIRKKRLMINIMALREIYERQELIDIY